MSSKIVTTTRYKIDIKEVVEITAEQEGFDEKEINTKSKEQMVAKLVEIIENIGVEEWLIQNIETNGISNKYV